mmetsp:Transcript_29575/g.63399  ORF Transcript_29575/g.63399 Transcript_29575/m.63399 type:complete len:371 (+) Transcript_29575:287-1399(+)|eukprot:CAMPEP_0201123648 /NCGR_PEP_ID=MMETSP0850-20130426/8507_1 /ASSEMBLY_ACC=CAM_ASM_000622 /TAXON_ID=183588 /ORGANISM="Pseudo-nitzschia fraudulenta, Strain WWA7" /LENGTH=370 /DNA_ID=CAMNT_0047390667 /DNA_START=219 /DNA_END=1331 /DNA_ORIENTATION=-
MPKALTLDTTSIEYAILPDHVKDDVPDRISVMLIQEENEYACFDYLAANEAIRRRVAKPVDEDCRVKMCEWCYQVVDFCKFRRETVGIGMSYLDRYMCSEVGKKALADRKEYQLVAMTCLYIAIKLHEPLEMETSLLADLSRGCYTEMEFANMEKRILEAIEWRVSGPTPLAFVLHYISFLPDTISTSVVEAIFDYSRYQTELAIADHYFVKTKPSVVGMAALLNALEGMDTNLIPERIQDRLVQVIILYTNMDIDEVEDIQMRLSNIILSLLDDMSTEKYRFLVQEESDEEDIDLSDDYDEGDVESDDETSDDEEDYEDGESSESSSSAESSSSSEEEQQRKRRSPAIKNRKSPTSVMRKSRSKSRSKK